MSGIDRRRANGKRRAESCRTCLLRDERQYQSLVRLAALLTGDADMAETVAADAMVAMPCSTARHHGSELCLTYLRQQVVTQSRRLRHVQADPPAGGASAGPEVPTGGDAAAKDDEAAPAEFAQLPVVAALRRLPEPVREAVVLTYYLDLPAAKAAAIAGVTEAALRANLATAMRDLDWSG